MLGPVGGPMQRFSGGPALGVGPQRGSLGGGSPMQSFKHGGKVKKTGLVKAEKGERVLTKKQQAKKGMK